MVGWGLGVVGWSQWMRSTSARSQWMGNFGVWSQGDKGLESQGRVDDKGGRGLLVVGVKGKGV